MLLQLQKILMRLLAYFLTERASNAAGCFLLHLGIEVMSSSTHIDKATEVHFNGCFWLSAESEEPGIQ